MAWGDHWMILASACVVFSSCGETPAVPAEQTLRVVRHQDDAVEVPPEVVAASGREYVLFADGPTVLFLNFDGGTINKAYKSDALSNSSFIGNGGAIPAFPGTAAHRTEVVTRVQQLFADFNVVVVDQRPSSGDYTMIMVGGWPSSINFAASSGTTGVAPLDCGNKMPAMSASPSPAGSSRWSRVAIFPARWPKPPPTRPLTPSGYPTPATAAT